jgi:hypothetical protein
MLAADPHSSETAQRSIERREPHCENGSSRKPCATTQLNQSPFQVLRAKREQIETTWGTGGPPRPLVVRTRGGCRGRLPAMTVSDGSLRAAAALPPTAATERPSR